MIWNNWFKTVNMNIFLFSLIIEKSDNIRLSVTIKKKSYLDMATFYWNKNRWVVDFETIIYIYIFIITFFLFNLNVKKTLIVVNNHYLI